MTHRPPKHNENIHKHPEPAKTGEHEPGAALHPQASPALDFSGKTKGSQNVMPYQAAPPEHPLGTPQAKIFTIRGVQVMLDGDLAELYGVQLRALNQAVRRNLERFPPEFCFQVTENEQEALRSQSVILEVEPQGAHHPLRPQIAALNPGAEGEGSLRSQSVTLKPGRGRHRKYLPYAFTEQGVAMLSSVLRSPAAVRVSIRIMQAFVEMRRTLQANAGLFQRLDGVERRQIAFETETDRRFEQGAVEMLEKLP